MSRRIAGAALAAAAVAGVGLRDRYQRQHSVLRNYPVLGHARYFLESIRPELQQYFIERNYDGRPFDRDTRSVIYQRAKGVSDEQAFGTERDVGAVGYDHILHATVPVPMLTEPPRITLGGPHCTQPFDTSLFNISSMSFGALSKNAILAMNKGAALGDFTHETGEGGLTEYHLKYGASVVWEFGSGYFGCRDGDGHFDPAQFADKAAHPSVRGILIKLSQGAKPGLGGQLPGSKVTPEIATARGVPVGKTVISPPHHSAFSTPLELIEFVQRLRELSGGKPVGFKLCVGNLSELLGICKAMRQLDITPDWITVDGAEGGTGAAPLEFEDHVGTPLTEGLIAVQNALVGSGLRDRVKIGAAGKIAGGHDIVKRVAMGADFTNSARGMMMATGCIQAQKCNTNKCPVGVATQDPKRYRAIDVDDKASRVQRYQAATVDSAMRVLASMGFSSFDDLGPHCVLRRISEVGVATYEDFYPWMREGELLAGTSHGRWAREWNAADPNSFAVQTWRVRRA